MGSIPEQAEGNARPKMSSAGDPGWVGRKTDHATETGS